MQIRFIINGNKLDNLENESIILILIMKFINTKDLFPQIL